MDARAALLNGLVDYAGLFPPASLDLNEALADYDGHLQGADVALLGRFVLPALRLTELSPWLATTWQTDRPLRLSLLASPEDLPLLADYLEDHPAVRAEALEARLPLGVDAAAWLDRLVTELVRHGLAGLEVYVELNPGTDDDQLAALSNLQGSHPLRRLGAKLRCGGVQAALVPPVARVAAVLVGARDRGVPLKFTAGLHHPVRGMDDTEGVPMHGFLNVYGAALLAHAHGLAAGDLEPILADTDPASFRLDAAGFGWRDLTIDAAGIAALRATVLGGYGSCSFDDPVTDLRSLALLP